ncbi:MAG: cbb3-type cytochrome oxidase assembly protein [Verrucomicrobiota bacterium JB022]|nr:cbb3-type cytochrome oxidase assembly protein [Verrucomicrobiota bacterium JB022]
MSWPEYIGIGAVFASLFFFGGVFALYWAKKNNQFDNLEESARVIFDEDEPEGTQTDFFPGKK